jgi:hypothetical protein
MEPTEMQQLQNQYSALCGQRGHLESQIMVAEDQIEEHKAGLERNLIELKATIKKVNELQRKLQYDQVKAQEAAQKEAEE